jgi:S1-C subfamily serine protease
MSDRSVSRQSEQGALTINLSRILIAGFLAGGVCLGEIRAADNPPAGNAASSIEQTVQEVFKRAEKAVVKIEAVDDHGHLCGTGFFVDSDGTLYTSYSVGGESHDIIVSRGDTKYPATRLIGDPRSGIAILKVEAG